MPLAGHRAKFRHRAQDARPNRAARRWPVSAQTANPAQGIRACFDRRSQAPHGTKIFFEMARRAGIGAGGRKHPDCRITVEDTACRILPQMADDFLERGNAASKAKSLPKSCTHSASRPRNSGIRWSFSRHCTALRSMPGSKVSRRIQTLLGDINDCVTVGQMVADYKDQRRWQAGSRSGNAEKGGRVLRVLAAGIRRPRQVRNRMHTLRHPRVVRNRWAKRTGRGGRTRLQSRPP